MLNERDLFQCWRGQVDAEWSEDTKYASHLLHCTPSCVLHCVLQVSDAILDILASSDAKNLAQLRRIEAYVAAGGKTNFFKIAFRKKSSDIDSPRGSPRSNIALSKVMVVRVETWCSHTMCIKHLCPYTTNHFNYILPTPGGSLLTRPSGAERLLP